MNANQQFSVSCHILAILAAFPDEAITSETIARSVDTNPVVIRRIMSRLRNHGLVESHTGTNGGWRLCHPAAELNLRKIYQAVGHESVLSIHTHPNMDCPIGGHIQDTLGNVFAGVQQALEVALETVSIANLLDQIKVEHCQDGASDAVQN